MFGVPGESMFKLSEAPTTRPPLPDQLTLDETLVVKMMRQDRRFAAHLMVFISGWKMGRAAGDKATAGDGDGVLQ